MFLQVIWNNNLKQTSLIASLTESCEDYQVIISFPLKEDISTEFVQNFIGSPQFQFLYIEDAFLWLENYHLTKNILAFFNVLDFIELNEQHLQLIDTFIHNKELSTNDFENLGFQSPVKTIARDFKNNPGFMKYFLNIADSSKRLLRTTFSFENEKILITINKREITAQQFFNHLNTNRDRLRIKESLAYEFENKENLFSYVLSLNIFTPKDNQIDNPPTTILQDNDSSENIELEDTEIEENQNLNVELFDTDDVNSDVTQSQEVFLIKEKTISLDLHSFLSLDNTNDVNGKDTSSKIEEALENFHDNQNNNFNDFFSTERTYEEYSLPENTTYIEEYDNSVFIEQKIEENNQAIIDIDSVEEELTEDFLVEIETNLQKHEQNILDSYNNDIEEDVEDNDNTELHFVSVDDLVDSINNIIEEPELILELIDIIDLPLVLFLSDYKPAIKDNIIDSNFIDNYFIDSDVNEEINQFSAEEVLTVVNTEVSIFENTVSDKKKKSGKNKKDKLSLSVINKDEEVINLIDKETIAVATEPKLDIVDNQNITPLIEIDETHNYSEVDNLFNDNVSYATMENKLEKIHCFDLSAIQFLEKVEIKPSLLIHAVELLPIIDFLIYVNIVDSSSSVEVYEQNFNFFEENKQRLIELCINNELDLIDDLYRNYPEFEKPLINFNYEGDNPMCIASFYENLDLLKKLIDYGWDANYFDSNLNNALIIAAAEGHKHIVRYLLTQNVQINFQNKIGYTALHFAINDCNHRIVKLLLEAGADVEISDNDRNTALSIAAFKGDINSAKLLLQTRVNVHTKNKKGYDARSIALIAKNHAIAKLIEEKIVSEKHNHSLPPIIEKNFEKNA